MRTKRFAALIWTRKRLLLPLLAVLAILCLSGCLRITVDDLYSLPRVSEEYLKLQQHIDSVLSLGAEFSPPVGGQYRQAVQLVDLNGSGRNEVIAFFSSPSENALKIYIFQMVDGDYTVAEIIEGGGTAFESVRYADMDGDGVMEIIVGWQMGAALKHFSIYSIKDFHSVLLAEAEYTSLTVLDINEDGNKDVVAIRLPTQEFGAVAELFTLMPDGEIVKEEARLSNGVETISRVLTGKLLDSVPAIFIDSEGKFDEGALVTDICAIRDGSFTNISMKGPSGISEETIRIRNYHSSDISDDGIIKTPLPRLLKAQSETPYYAIDWYAFNSQGLSRLVLTTYHNTFDEWYLVLPLDWRGKVSIRRDDGVAGERTVIFSYIAGDEGPYEDFLKIYKLSGDRGEERAKLPGRVKLLSEGAAVYAFELLALPNSYGLTFNETLITKNFRLIYSDWLTGTS